jgi:hypothetical protein
VYTCSEPRSPRPDLVGKSRPRRLFPTTRSLTPLPSILRTLFQVPYPASPAFATLTKTPGVWGYSSHSGTQLWTQRAALNLLLINQLRTLFIAKEVYTPSSAFRLRRFRRADVSCAPKSFICNTYEPPRKRCKQKTYGFAKPFRCNIYAKHGGRARPSNGYRAFFRRGRSLCRWWREWLCERRRGRRRSRRRRED